MFKAAMQGYLELEGADRTLKLAPMGERLTLGRATTASLSVNDTRVSRVHATIEWRGGQYVLSDLSSFGTWVYMGNQAEPVVLRRTECYLVGQGEIALGCDRVSDAAPLVRFSIKA
jgi:predicted component of type VI protein secretion system